MSCKEAWAELSTALAAGSTFIATGGVDGAWRCERAGCNALVRKDTGRCLQGHAQESRFGPQGERALLGALRCVLDEMAARGIVLDERAGFVREAITKTLAGQRREDRYIGGARTDMELALEEIAKGDKEGRWTNDPRVVAARAHIQPRPTAEKPVTGIAQLLTPRPMTLAEYLEAQQREGWEQHWARSDQLREQPHLALGLVDQTGAGVMFWGQATGVESFGNGLVMVAEKREGSRDGRPAERQAKKGRFRYAGQTYDLHQAQVWEYFTPESERLLLAPGPGIGFILPRHQMRRAVVPSETADAMGIYDAEDTPTEGWGGSAPTATSLDRLIGDPGLAAEYPDITGPASEWLAGARQACRPGRYVLARRLAREAVRQAAAQEASSMVQQGLELLRDLARHVGQEEWAAAYERARAEFVQEGADELQG